METILTIVGGYFVLRFIWYALGHLLEFLIQSAGCIFIFGLLAAAAAVISASMFLFNLVF